MLGAHSCTLFALQMDCAADLLPVTGSTEDAGLNRGNLSQEHQYCDEEDVFQEMSGSLASQDNVLSEQQVWASESQQLLLKCPLRSGSLCTHTAQSPWDPSLPHSAQLCCQKGGTGVLRSEEAILRVALEKPG